MTPPPGSFRVVVVRPALDSDLSGADAAASLAERIPLPEAARIALCAGRSAVVRSAVTEPQARRVATLVMKLGFEVRIEPDEAAPSTRPPEVSPQPRTAAAPVDPPAITAPDGPPPPLDNDGYGRSDATEPVLMEHLPPWEEGPRGGDSVADRRLPVPAASASDRAPAEPESEAPAAAVRLVRCPAHGLLYDASKSTGCSRCLGGTQRALPRLLPTLRARPRLWLASGVLLAVGLGAVPAVIYTQQVKSGSLLERRIEAQAIRAGRGQGHDARAAYREACAQVDRVRAQAMAITALIWLSTSVILLLLYRRFV